jgi:hypothetical protein
LCAARMLPSIRPYRGMASYQRSVIRYRGFWDNGEEQ